MSREITIKLTAGEAESVVCALEGEIFVSQRWADLYVGRPRARRYRDQVILARALQAKFIRAAGKTGGGA